MEYYLFHLEVVHTCYYLILLFIDKECTVSVFRTTFGFHLYTDALIPELLAFT